MNRKLTKDDIGSFFVISDMYEDGYDDRYICVFTRFNTNVERPAFPYYMKVLKIIKKSHKHNIFTMLHEYVFNDKEVIEEFTDEDEILNLIGEFI